MKLSYDVPARIVGVWGSFGVGKPIPLEETDSYLEEKALTLRGYLHGLEDAGVIQNPHLIRKGLTAVGAEFELLDKTKREVIDTTLRTDYKATQIP